MDDDARNLDLLAIAHYVGAGFVFLCGCFPIIHLGIGLAIMFGVFPNEKGDGLPEIFGLVFVLLAIAMIALFWAFAIALAVAGNSLKQRSRYTFCLVVAAIACTFVPFGTVLGVLTIIVLVRPNVKAMFDDTSSAHARARVT